MDVRMVVTGKTAEGRSVFVSDEQVAPATVAMVPGGEFHRFWGSDEVLQVPLDGTVPAHTTYFPPAGGFRFIFFTLPPADAPASVDFDAGEAMQEVEEKLP